MKLAELYEGWFPWSKKKDAEEPRADFTEEDRDLVRKIFTKGHNADVRFNGKTGDYVLPGNITVVLGRTRTNIYKRGNTIHANVEFYDDTSGPGNPRQSPKFHHDVVIKSEKDLIDLRKLMGTLTNEGFKMGLAAAAISAATVLGVVNSNPVRVDDVRYTKAAGPVGPNSKVITADVDGKPTKIRVWRSLMKNQQGLMVYKVEK